MKPLFKAILRSLGFELRSLRPYPRDDWVAVIRNLPWRHPFACLVDVGANVGQTSLHLRAQFPDAVIHAFEPCASTHAILVQRVRHDTAIHPHCLALGDRPGLAHLVHADDSQLHTLRLVAAHEGGEREPVDVETLDSFAACHGLDQIDLLKTDAEGFDAEVIHGASRLLANGAVAAVLAEFTLVPSDHSHTPLLALNALLYPAGFRLFDLYDLARWDNEVQFGNALYINPAHLHLSARP